MTKIKIMSVREEDIVYVEDWAKKNNVEYELSRHPLTDDNIDEVEGFDGLSLSQQIPISEEVFVKLKSFGIKQIAQR
ncbi:lactate dehydrogenase, partial [Staphylococcus saprophyticus]